MEMLAQFEPSLGWVVLLFGVGVVFALAEVVIPSGGLLTILSVAAFVGAIVLGFLVSFTAGMLTLLAAILSTPLLMYVAVRIWPHTPIARRIILSGPQNLGTAGDLSRLDPETLKGRVGVTKTMLRPAGKMVLDGRSLDCVTEGDLIEAGRPVTILDVHGSKVIVRAATEAEESAEQGPPTEEG